MKTIQIKATEFDACKISRALQCLEDNGIEKDECGCPASTLLRIN